MKRVSLHVDSGREWRGGQAQVLHLLRGLRAAGEEPILACPAGSPLAERAAASDLRVVPVALRGEWDLVSIARLQRLLRRVDAAVVHAHTAHAVTLAGLAGSLARTPLRVAARRVDFPVSRSGRVKLTHLADRVVAVSEAIRAVLVRSGVPPERIDVVHSGIDLAALERRAAADLRPELAVPGAPLVGAVGALVDHKDHRTLLDAFAAISHPDAVLLIAGDGPLRADLERRIDRLGLFGRVRLLGFRDDAAAVVRALDLFVQPSRTEGLGTAVLDAMALARPVVATRAGGIPEMIDDGHDGLLVPPGDPRALAAAIDRALAEPALARRLATAAARKVRERFSAGQMVAATRRLYDGLTPAAI